MYALMVIFQNTYIYAKFENPIKVTCSLYTIVLQNLKL